MGNDGETLGDADEEPVSIDMLFEVVDLGLLHVAKITYTQGELRADGSVDGQHVSPLGSRDERGGNDIVVVIP